MWFETSKKFLVHLVLFTYWEFLQTFYTPCTFFLSLYVCTCVWGMCPCPCLWLLEVYAEHLLSLSPHLTFETGSLLTASNECSALSIEPRRFCCVCLPLMKGLLEHRAVPCFSHRCHTFGLKSHDGGTSTQPTEPPARPLTMGFWRTTWASLHLRGWAWKAELN